MSGRGKGRGALQPFSPSTLSPRTLKLAATIENHGLDALCCVALFAFAAWVRVAGVWAGPPISDEYDDLLLAQAVSRGEARPIAGVLAYLGPLPVYVLAAAFSVFGASETVARAVWSLIGAAAPPLIYVLGHSLHGRLAGLVAASLLIGNALAVFEARQFSNGGSYTPCFTLLGVLLMMRHVLRSSPTSFVMGGFFIGLASNTHPSGVFAATAIAVWLLVRHRSIVVTRLGVAAVAAALVANASFIVGFMRDGFASQAYSFSRASGSAAGEPFSIAQVASVANNLALLLIRLPVGAWSYGREPQVDPAESAAIATDWPIYVFTIWLLAAIGWSLRRKDALPALMLLPGIVVVLVLRVSVDSSESRYFLASFTIVCVSMGAAAHALVQRFRPLIRVPLLSGIVGLALLAPMHYLAAAEAGYAPRMQAQLWTQRLADLAIELRRPGETIYVDPTLPWIPSLGLNTRLRLRDYSPIAPPATLAPGIYVTSPHSELRNRLEAAGLRPECCEGRLDIWPPPATNDWGDLGRGWKLFRLPAVAAGSYAADVLADHPYAFWRFEETSGGTAEDSTGRRYDGRLEGALRRGAQGIGGGSALAFDRSGGVVRLEHDGRLSGGWREFSIETWIKPERAGGIVDKNRETGWSLYLGESDFRAAVAGGTMFVGSWKGGSWYYLVLTSDGRAVRFYINGDEFARQEPNEMTSRDEITIGRYSDGSTAFAGLIDEVAYYDFALPAERIRSHWQKGREAFEQLGDG